MLTPTRDVEASLGFTIGFGCFFILLPRIIQHSMVRVDVLKAAIECAKIQDMHLKQNVDLE